LINNQRLSITFIYYQT